MKDQSISRKVTLAFDSSKESPEELNRFLDRLCDSYVEAEKATNRGTRILLLTWAIAAGAGLGVFDEGTVANLKPKEVTSLLIIVPPMLGFLHYLIATRATTAGRLRIAISTFYRNILPAFHEASLHLLIGHPSILATERFLDSKAYPPWVHRLRRTWTASLILGLPIGSLLAFAHISYLLSQTTIWSNWQLLLSLLIGLVLWSRGIIVWLEFDQ